jgi:hypothetical protein
MAEAFSNKLVRAAGSVQTSTGCTIGITTTNILGVTTAGLSVGDLVDNQNFIAGTKIATIGVGSIFANRDSTNTGSSSGNSVKFLGVTTAYSSASSVKSIIIGGTFANNTNNQVSLSVVVEDNSTGTDVALASKIPVPAGSSFVISDTGKTLLEGDDKVKIYVDANNAIDVSLSILTGVN